MYIWNRAAAAEDPQHRDFALAYIYLIVCTGISRLRVVCVYCLKMGDREVVDASANTTAVDSNTPATNAAGSRLQESSDFEYSSKIVSSSSRAGFQPRKTSKKRTRVDSPPNLDRALLLGHGALPTRLVRSGWLGVCGDGLGLDLGRAGLPSHLYKRESNGQARPRFATCMKWDNGGRMLAVGCNDGCVLVYDSAVDWPVVLQLVAHAGPVTSMTWLHLPTAANHSSSSSDGTNTGTPSSYVSGANLLATADDTGAVRLWCLSTGHPVAEVAAPSPVIALAGAASNVDDDAGDGPVAFATRGSACGVLAISCSDGQLCLAVVTMRSQRTADVQLQRVPVLVRRADAERQQHLQQRQRHEERIDHQNKRQKLSEVESATDGVFDDVVGAGSAEIAADVRGSGAGSSTTRPASQPTAPQQQPPEAWTQLLWHRGHPDSGDDVTAAAANGTRQRSQLVLYAASTRGRLLAWRMDIPLHGAADDLLAPTPIACWELTLTGSVRSMSIVAPPPVPAGHVLVAETPGSPLVSSVGSGGDQIGHGPTVEFIACVPGSDGDDDGEDQGRSLVYRPFPLHHLDQHQQRQHHVIGPLLLVLGHDRSLRVVDGGVPNADAAAAATAAGAKSQARYISCGTPAIVSTLLQSRGMDTQAHRQAAAMPDGAHVIALEAGRCSSSGSGKGVMRCSVWSRELLLAPAADTAVRAPSGGASSSAPSRSMTAVNLVYRKQHPAGLPFPHPSSGNSGSGSGDGGAGSSGEDGHSGSSGVTNTGASSLPPAFSSRPTDLSLANRRNEAAGILSCLGLGSGVIDRLLGQADQSTGGAMALAGGADGAVDIQPGPADDDAAMCLAVHPSQARCLIVAGARSGRVAGE